MIQSIAAKFTLGKADRLKSRKMISELFGNGKSIAAYPLRAIFVFNDEEGVRAGFTVSTRNFKKAVHRNRIKRLMREAYRNQKTKLQEKVATDRTGVILFFIYTGKELPDLRVVSEKMDTLLTQVSKESKTR